MREYACPSVHAAGVHKCMRIQATIYRDDEDEVQVEVKEGGRPRRKHPRRDPISPNRRSSSASVSSSTHIDGLEKNISNNKKKIVI